MHYEIDFFLRRLDDWAVIGIIRDINEALQTGHGDTELQSDDYEDLDVKIKFPDFCIDNYTLSLVEMKICLYKRLHEINPSTSEYLNDIESGNPATSTFRKWNLLKFEFYKSQFGFKKFVCKSLTKHGKLPQK